MAETIIDGATFFEWPNDPYVRCKTILSADRRFLAAISQGRRDGLCRVRLYERSTDAQWVGEFWGQVGDPSLTDTLEAAEHLARSRLATLGGG